MVSELGLHGCEGFQLQPGQVWEGFEVLGHDSSTASAILVANAIASAFVAQMGSPDTHMTTPTVPLARRAGRAFASAMIRLFVNRFELISSNI